MENRKWTVPESQIWVLLAQIKCELMNNSCDKFNDLVAGNSQTDMSRQIVK